MKPISVCIIAKNEERCIEKCLEALKPLNAEIIVTDTGSTDRTKEIAKKYTDKVYDFEWVRDFSAARNFCAKQASNDWILIIDCDEYLTDFDVDAITAIQKKSPTVIGTIEQQNLMGQGENRTLSVSHPARFYNGKTHHFTGTIHEQIVPYSEKIPLSYFSTGVIVSHDGYFGTREEQREKDMRNITMLEEALKKEPDNLYLLFQLGKNYYAIGEYETAFPYFQKGLTQSLNYTSETTLDFVVIIMKCSIMIHRPEESFIFLEHYEELSKYADFVLNMGHIYAETGNYLKALTEYLKATTIPLTMDAGSNTYLPFFYAGYVYQSMGDANMAKAMYTKAAEYDYLPAKEALAKLL